MYHGFESLGKEELVIKFVQTHPDAQVPTKQRQNDLCWDLTLVELIDWQTDFLFFDSGIAVQPPDGYFFRIVPRSSIHKTGMMLANSVGMIEPEYTGSLKAAFWVQSWYTVLANVIDEKYSKESNEYELKIKKPFRCLQLELCRIQPDFSWTQVESLEKTDRGDAGFGSSGLN